MSSRGFDGRVAYVADNGYQLLPFRFNRLKDDSYVATNDVGEYVILSEKDLHALLAHELEPDQSAYRTLKARHFLFDPGSRASLDLLALKYRTRAERTAWFTGLHMFVVTLRCDHSCQYCQVSRQTEDRTSFDMSVEHADKAVEMVFRSPSPSIKIEFQGGEPLLNLPLIKRIVERATALNQQHQRRLQFVIASNLSRLTDEVLAFCKANGVLLSTSIDGPEDLHNAQRPVRGGHSFRTTIEAVSRAREVLGQDKVAALMTTTHASLPRVEQIVDEYVHQQFHSIFLRSISPYGFAIRTSLRKRYDAVEWLDFYKRGLSYILRVNREGYSLREEYTSILLQKMFSPEGPSYVDLQSPAGIGIAAIVYNYDGAVYASDEGRMLAEMGDHSFRLGHLDSNSYESMLTSEPFVRVLSETMLEGAPQCSDCAFLPYCGSDPVFHRATQGDPVGHKAFSSFCRKQMGVIEHLIGLLERDKEARDILMEWV